MASGIGTKTMKLLQTLILKEFWSKVEKVRFTKENPVHKAMSFLTWAPPSGVLDPANAELHKFHKKKINIKMFKVPRRSAEAMTPCIWNMSMWGAIAISFSHSLTEVQHCLAHSTTAGKSIMTAEKQGDQNRHGRLQCAERGPMRDPRWNGAFWRTQF